MPTSSNYHARNMFFLLDTLDCKKIEAESRAVTFLNDYRSVQAISSSQCLTTITCASLNDTYENASN